MSREEKMKAQQERWNKKKKKKNTNTVEKSKDKASPYNYQQGGGTPGIFRLLGKMRSQGGPGADTKKISNVRTNTNKTSSTQAKKSDELASLKKKLKRHASGRSSVAKQKLKLKIRKLEGK